MNRTLRAALLGSAGGFLLVAPVAAQESAAAPDVITVTAQKREQSLQDVPLSISVITGDRLEEQGVNDLQDVAAFTPGVIIQEGETNTIRIRGIDNDSPNIAFEQATAVFNDGIYYGRPLQLVAGIVDVEQVEILFGPQPVYFGQSAIAGLVAYNSVRPTYGREMEDGQLFDGFAIGEVGNIGQRKIEGAVGFGLGDDWGLRVAGKYAEHDGWTTVFGNGQSGNAQEDTLIRVSLAGDVTNNLSVYGKHEYFEQSAKGLNQDTIVCVPGGPAICPSAVEDGIAPPYAYDGILALGGFVSAAPLGGAPAGNLDLTTLPQAQFDAIGNNTDGTATVAEVVYEFDNGIAITSLTGLTEYASLRLEDFDATPYASLMFPNDEDYDQFSQELRIQSGGDGRFDWMAGLYYQEQNMNFEFDIISALPNPMGPSGTNAITYDEDAEYLSFFGSLGFQLTDQITFEYGLRYQDIQKDALLQEVDSFLTDADGNRITNTGDPFNPDVGIFTGATIVPNGTQAFGWSGLLPTSAAGDRCIGLPAGEICPGGAASLGALDLDDDDIQHQATLRWEPVDTASLFLRYVEGYKAGGFSRGSSSFILSNFGQYDAETATSYEVGGKFNLLDNSLALNATLFRTEYKDRQVNSAFVDPVTDALFFIFINAAESTVQGIEADATYVTDNGFNFRYAIAYNDSEYDSFPNAQCFRFEGENGLCTGDTIDLSGTSFDGQPDWTMSFGGGYEFGLTDNMFARLSADYTLFAEWDGTRPGAALPEYAYREQDGFGLLNVRAGIGPEDRGWEVALFARNLTDELYWLNQPVDINPFGDSAAQVNRPRTYGATFRVNFGAR